MDGELEPLEIGDMPEVIRIAEEVHATGRPRVLRRDHEEVAVVMPPTPVRHRRRLAGKPTSADDPLWAIVGIAHSGGPGDVSENKYKYLAEAYTPREE
jgi:hypothetical protein